MNTTKLSTERLSVNRLGYGTLPIGVEFKQNEKLGTGKANAVEEVRISENYETQGSKRQHPANDTEFKVVLLVDRSKCF